MNNEVKFGKNVKLSKYINLYGCVVGDNTKIGAFVEIQKNAFVGKNCKISSHTFICEGVTIKDNCFIGHGVVFINDKYPVAVGEWKQRLLPTQVCNGVSIGSNSTIMADITIGNNSLIGAGSVVTKSIPDNEVWAGNPARFLRKNDR